MNIQLRQIRCFVAVATEKSFAQAAKRLNVSAPALSQTISVLEQDLGLSLFERTTRRVTLTPVGERLLANAHQLELAAKSFSDEVRAIQIATQNELRVGYMIGTGVELIPPIIREFEHAKPLAVLKLMEFDFTDPSAGLATGRVDCGIIRPPIGLDSLDVREIAREKCVVCLPTAHPLRARKSVRLVDILDEPIIAATTQGIWRDYWLANHYRRDRPARVSFETDTVESELQAVALGRGISITAESTARYYARPGVLFRPISDMDECVIAVASRPNPSRLAQEFVAICDRVARRVGAAKRSVGVARSAPRASRKNQKL
jgi:DNA-binding transcriptional LysR family regulator